VIYGKILDSLAIAVNHIGHRRVNIAVYSIVTRTTAGRVFSRRSEPMAHMRVPDDTYRVIRDLAGKGSMQAVVSQAVEMLRRQRMIDEANAAYAALREDPEAWKQELEERALWENAMGDGLEEE
jgi:hypothetical protein